jgi:hypothetical protein
MQPGRSGFLRAQPELSTSALSTGPKDGDLDCLVLDLQEQEFWLRDPGGDSAVDEDRVG